MRTNLEGVVLENLEINDKKCYDMKNFIILLASILVLGSCSSDYQETEPDFLGMFGIFDETEARSVLGNYMIFGSIANGGVLMRSRTQDDDISFSDGGCSLSAIYKEDLADYENISDGGTFHFGDIQMDYLPTDDPNTPQWYIVSQINNASGSPTTTNLPGPHELNDCEYLHPYYGTPQDVKLIRNGQTIFETTLDTYDRLVSFDLPVEEPVGQTSVLRLDLTQSNNFNFTWNADIDNENGILIVATGKGDIAGENPNSTGDFIYQIENLPDNGSASLPASFFAPFANNEYVTLTLYRGAFQFLEGTDGKTYKTYSMSEIEMVTLLNK